MPSWGCINTSMTTLLGDSSLCLYTEFRTGFPVCSLGRKKPSTKLISIVTRWAQGTDTIISQIEYPSTSFWWDRLWPAVLQERIGRNIPVTRMDIYLSVCHLEREKKIRKEEKHYFLFSCRCLEIILQISLLQLAQTNGTVMTYSHEDRNYFIKSVGRYC